MPFVPVSHPPRRVYQPAASPERLLGFLKPEGTTYSEDEEREVIKRLKAFGYL